MDRNSSGKSNLVIKVQHGDTLRRFGACVHGQAMDIDMANLKAKIVTLFKFKPDAQMLLTYNDKDGAMVTLDSDDELYDAAIMQRLKPLRINVRLISADPRDGQASREASGLPRFGTQQPHINSAFTELLKSVPEPLLHTVARISNDVVSKAASSSPVLAEIFDQLSKVEFASASQPSQAASGSSVAPEVTSAGLQDLNTNEKPEHANQPILNDQVKERGNKQSESANLTRAAHTHTANPAEVNVGNVYATQNEAFNDLLGSGWTIGNEGHERGLGGQYEEKGKAVIDGDVSVPPLAGPSEDKQSQNFGTAPVDNELRDNGNKPPLFGTASMTSLVPPNAQTGFPDYTGIALSEIPLPNEFPPPIHPYGSARSYNGSGIHTFHRGISCDSCGTHPIRGPRFKSNVKEGQELCGSCFTEIGNQTDYTRIDRAPYPSPRPFKESFSHLPRHRRAVCGVRPFKMKLASCFIQDVTVHDGTIIPPYSPFTKIWRMRNNGTIAWPYGTRLVWIGGDKLETQDSVNLEIPATGYPVYEELDIAVDFVSPSRPGLYVSYWRMASPSGLKFGQHVWIMIKVDNSETSSDGSYQSHIKLNHPTETSGDNGIGIIDVNGEPQKDAALANDMTHELVKGLGNDVPMQKSEPAPGVDNRDGLITQPLPAIVPRISYPIVDLTASSCGESAAVPVGSTLEGNCLEQTLPEGLEKRLMELEEMGSKQVDPNKEVLRLNEYNLEQSVDDLCGFAEWDPLLHELQEMGFNDKQKDRNSCLWKACIQIPELRSRLGVGIFQFEISAGACAHITGSSSIISKKK